MLVKSIAFITVVVSILVINVISSQVDFFPTTEAIEETEEVRSTRYLGGEEGDDEDGSSTLGMRRRFHKDKRVSEVAKRIAKSALDQVEINPFKEETLVIPLIKPQDEDMQLLAEKLLGPNVRFNYLGPDKSHDGKSQYKSRIEKYGEEDLEWVWGYFLHNYKPTVEFTKWTGETTSMTQSAWKLTRSSPPVLTEQSTNSPREPTKMPLSTTMNTRSFTCPENLGPNMPCWIFGSGICYCFSLFTVNWITANKKCSRSNMNLVSFETLDLLNGIPFDYIVPELKGYAYWTSGKYNESVSQWQWTKKREPTLPIFENLSLSRDRNQEKKCIAFYYDTDYHDAFISRFCDSYGYRFICEHRDGIA